METKTSEDEVQTYTKEEALEVLSELDLPVNEYWMWVVIRHGARNMDIDLDGPGDELSRYDGGKVARLLNSLPSLLA